MLAKRRAFIGRGAWHFNCVPVVRSKAAPAQSRKCLYDGALNQNTHSGRESATPPERSMFAQRRWFSHRPLKFASHGFVWRVASRFTSHFASRDRSAAVRRSPPVPAAKQHGLIGTFYLHRL